MGKRTVTQQRGKKRERERERRYRATRNTCLVANVSSFLRGGVGGTENKATRWQHSWGSYYLSSYTVTFVWRF